MTESEWVACGDTQKMLEFLRDCGKLSDRKARLFAVACCRRVWRLLGDERSWSAVEVTERYADMLASTDEFRAAVAAAWDAKEDAAAYLASEEPFLVAWKARQDVGSGTLSETRIADEAAMQCRLLHCIGENPFHAPLPVSSSWLTWDNGTVRRLAEAAYNEHQLPAGTLDVARLSVLADALEEAGCDDAGLLGHLRSAGPHVRGCFVLDLLLQKG
jgi:hypothetical protein